MAALQPDLPPTFLATREALHRVAEELVAPARKPPNEIALARTPGGFGTPRFEFEGERMQVRCEGAELVVARGEAEERIALTSLAEAGARLGGGLLSDGLPDDPAPLDVDQAAAECLAEFYAFADEALRAFTANLPAESDPSDIHLWPEHFDLALEAGSEAAGQRATYGASPGDADHDEPYLYVGPWKAPPPGDLWNATAFTGAELTYPELAASDDQLAVAREFFEAHRQALTA